MTAVMLRALHRLEVPQYWRVARFVSVVMDMVPELLLDPHWTQLCTGLRAKYILELCRCEKPADPEQLTALLDEVTRPRPPSAGQEEEKEVEEEVEKEVEANFVELVHTMLKDPEVKQNFFTEVYPVAYGPDYDRDLLTLFQELLCRLAQLLPIPDLGQGEPVVNSDDVIAPELQTKHASSVLGAVCFLGNEAEFVSSTVSWLGRGGSLLDECDGAVSSAHLRGLLGHHRQLAHLEQHVPPSSMGDCILSALAGPPPAGPPSQSASPLSPGDHAPHGAAVAEVMVTDYAEVELGTTAPSQEEEEEEEEGGVC
ncbi:hypothetical protein N1851_031627 [Merluccius polli]|uniref:TERF1-interacting nuclear factor 2 N-terminal domain-containing protein n=1 Tax=Merluccius polli TaxID=89951 RepID=A0AA47M3L0_MERPO|nr:hypothetical protein N1851_031627 [Merluccius polli]